MIVKTNFEHEGYLYDIHRNGLLHSVAPKKGQGPRAAAIIPDALESYFQSIEYGFRRNYHNAI